MTITTSGTTKTTRCTAWEHRTIAVSTGQCGGYTALGQNRSVQEIRQQIVPYERTAVSKSELFDVETAPYAWDPREKSLLVL